MNPEILQNPGRLVWSGAHWINATRDGNDDDAPVTWVSLYHTQYSAAGEGCAAHVLIPDAGINAVFADNLELADWTSDRFFANSTFRPPDAPARSAKFTRCGDIDRDPSWVIETDEHRIVARWQPSEAPVIAYGPFAEGKDYFTIVFFTWESTVEVNGAAIPGKPYARDIWQKSIGGDRSSSCVALSETLIERYRI